MFESGCVVLELCSQTNLYVSTYFLLLGPEFRLFVSLFFLHLLQLFGENVISVHLL